MMEVTGLKHLGALPEGNNGFKTFGGIVGTATGLKRLGASPNRVLSLILLCGSWACSRFMFYPALFCVSVEGRVLYLCFLARHAAFIINISHCMHQRTVTRINCEHRSGLLF